MKNALLPLEQAFSPSPPCDCEICRDYCKRPGWWTVGEARRALGAGYGGRMMLEMSPDRTFGVLSPAFLGCEGGFALQVYANKGCCFLHRGMCQLHGTGLQPLECRFCHHSRQGLGQKCHEALEKDWQTSQGQHLVQLWAVNNGLWLRLGLARADK